MTADKLLLKSKADSELEIVEIPAKISKKQDDESEIQTLNEESATATKSIHLNSDVQLNKIEFVRVLNVISSRKTIFIEGKYENEKLVLILEKLPIDQKNALEILQNTDKSLQRDFFNDIYGNYLAYPDANVNAIKTVIIHPATDKHIEKYCQKKVFLLNETADDYYQITLPYINGSQFSIDWVFNILEHKQEAERIVLEDTDSETGFVLIPDLKWNGKQIDNLYLVAIVRKKGIKSLRDLTAEHLPLLKNVKKKSLQLIQEKYDLNENELRIYLHYQPSYYHLHIHFTNLKFDAPSIQIGRSHLLSTVISNLELYPDYYQRSTLTFVVRECDSLYDEFIQKQKKSIEQ